MIDALVGEGDSMYRNRFCGGLFGLGYDMRAQNHPVSSNRPNQGRFTTKLSMALLLQRRLGRQGLAQIPQSGKVVFLVPLLSVNLLMVSSSFVV